MMKHEHFLTKLYSTAQGFDLDVFIYVLRMPELDYTSWKSNILNFIMYYVSTWNILAKSHLDIFLLLFKDFCFVKIHHHQFYELVKSS